MTLREFLNAILGVIGASSLTDGEYSGIDLEGSAFDLETYEALLTVLDSRESMSCTRDRLRFYFLARGVEVPESSPGKSQIFVGGVLE